MTAALGFLAAPIATDQVRTHLTRLDRADWRRVTALLAEMEAETIATLRAAGVPPRGITVEQAADMRYAGQGFEVTAPLPRGPLGAARAPAIARAFLEAYRERSGQATRDQPLEVVSCRVRAHGPLPRVALEPTPGGGDLRRAQTGRRPVYSENRFVNTPVYDRARLGSGVTLRGPAILEEHESTLVVPPGARVTIDRSGNAVVTLRPGRAR